MPLWSVVGLLALVIVCYGIGQGTNGAAAVATVVFFVGVPLLYFAPTINAVRRDHPRKTPLIVVNLFLGWTLIGWILALAWSYAAAPQPVAVAAPLPAANDPREQFKKCPFCAEDVKAAAIKCKHCGSELMTT